jgi:uncharacterized FlaG/YvyC family protein
MEVNRVNSIEAAAATAALAANDNRAQTTPELAEAVTAVNGAKLFGQDSELTFAMDRESRQMVVRLVDRKTRQLIRQIPQQYLLDLRKTLRTSSTAAAGEDPSAIRG